MRFTCIVVLLAALSACNRGNQSKDAIRQGVIDYLSGKTSSLALNMSAMDVEVTSVSFNGNQADASVSITPKGTPGGGMSMNYHLEQDGSRWVVKGHKDAGGTPHGGGALPPGGAPGTANPHGAMAPGATGGAMPSPEDLPPTGKKK